MGFFFRKSVKFGPFRINFSKSGIGLSTGVRGARISVGPRGAFVNVGAGGFYYRKKLNAKTRPAASDRNQENTEPVIAECPDCGQSLEIPQSAVGREYKCSCGHTFAAGTFGENAVTTHFGWISIAVLLAVIVCAIIVAAKVSGVAFNAPPFGGQPASAQIVSEKSGKAALRQIQFPDNEKKLESAGVRAADSDSASSSGDSSAIQTGSRGGKYYINSHGKKTYVKKK